ncbi:MAG TPA: hypothetical protein VMF65_19330 [Acidimicrobiales bacterium]|nr:hypothetical protein [Acidimicrobiales bacterium]
MPRALFGGGADRFLRAEAQPLGFLAVAGAAPSGPKQARVAALGTKATTVSVAGIGTTAAKAVHGPLLAEALGTLGCRVASATALGSPAELINDPSWQLAVVLSPYKREVGEHCDRLAPSATATGVVDTVIRTPAGTVGFNTNTWAAQSALEVLLGGAEPQRVLVLGAGASARSVALAVRRAWPGCELAIVARSLASAEALAAQFSGEAIVAPSAERAPDVVVNTTTWGETEASEAEPLEVDLAGALAPGVRFFDLNNRVGALPVQALQAGCSVLSGNVMQRVTNASRAALARFTAANC